MYQEKTKGFIAEFKQFIARGNVMDMAVGVIVGGAFKAIADSLTADIIMPIIGIFVSENSFADLSLTVGTAVITNRNFIGTQPRQGGNRLHQGEAHLWIPAP